MEGSNCDGKGGWMRVGYLNMTEPNTICPPRLTLRQFPNIDHGVCGRNMSSSTFYSAHGFCYSKVCGQIRGYQFKSPDGFPPLFDSNASPNIENCNTYVDGVTITYGSNPRKHIWTYACGVSEAAGIVGHPPQYICPCNNDSNDTYVPEWIGNDYYCESGLHSEDHQEVLYSNDTLWDGQQCGGNEGPCVTLDDLYDKQPSILELTDHARTAKWNLLGVKLELDSEALAECYDHTSMYQLWIQEKAENATRRNLITALRAIKQNNVAHKYEEYLIQKSKVAGNKDTKDTTRDGDNLHTTGPTSSSGQAASTEVLYDSKLYKEFTEVVMVNAKADHKVGLAVIFGVVNKTGPQGADLDIKNVKETFDVLNYATWVIKNPTPTIMESVVNIVSGYKYFSIELKWVVFYYAGHGGSRDKKGYFILPCDNNKHEVFPIDSKVIEPFQPGYPSCHLEDRKRLFLFDCCLKEDTTETLPATAPPPLDPNLPCYQPANDYTIVAHATYYREVSRGDFSKGGLWTIKLCDNIRECATDMEVNDILIKTRDEVICDTKYKVQAPFQMVNCGRDYLV